MLVQYGENKRLLAVYFNRKYVYVHIYTHLWSTLRPFECHYSVGSSSSKAKGFPPVLRKDGKAQPRPS